MGEERGIGDGKQNMAIATLPVTFAIYLPGWRDAPQRYPVASTYQRRSRRPCSASAMVSRGWQWRQVKPGNQLKTISTRDRNFQLVCLIELYSYVSP